MPVTEQERLFRQLIRPEEAKASASTESTFRELIGLDVPLETLMQEAPERSSTLTQDFQEQFPATQKRLTATRREQQRLRRQEEQQERVNARRASQLKRRQRRSPAARTQEAEDAQAPLPEQQQPSTAEQAPLPTGTVTVTTGTPPEPLATPTGTVTVTGGQRVLPPSPEGIPTPAELFQGVKADIEDLFVGYRKGTAIFPHLIANLIDLIEKGGEVVNQQFFGGKLEPGTLLPKIQQGLRDTVEELATDPRGLDNPQEFRRKILQGLGSAVPGLAAAATAIATGGGPIRGLAGLGALNAADRGLVDASIEALRGGLLGTVLRTSGGLPRAERIPIIGGAFGAEALIATGDPVDAMVATLIGAGLAIPGRGGPGLRTRLRQFNESLEQRVQTAEGRTAVRRQGPAILNDILEGLKAGRSETEITRTIRTKYTVTPRQAQQLFRRGQAVRLDALKGEFGLTKDPPVAEPPRGPTAEPSQRPAAAAGVPAEAPPATQQRFADTPLLGIGGRRPIAPTTTAPTSAIEATFRQLIGAPETPAVQAPPTQPAPPARPGVIPLPGGTLTPAGPPPETLPLTPAQQDIPLPAVPTGVPSAITGDVVPTPGQAAPVAPAATTEPIAPPTPSTDIGELAIGDRVTYLPPAGGAEAEGEIVGSEFNGESVGIEPAQASLGTTIPIPRDQIVQVTKPKTGRRQLIPQPSKNTAATAAAAEPAATPPDPAEPTAPSAPESLEAAYRRGQNREKAGELTIPRELQNITGIQEALAVQGRTVPWENLRNRWELALQGTAAEDFSTQLTRMQASLTTARKATADYVRDVRDILALRRDPPLPRELDFLEARAEDIQALDPASTSARDALNLVVKTRTRIADAEANRQRQADAAKDAALTRETAKWSPWREATVKKPLPSEIEVTKTNAKWRRATVQGEDQWWTNGKLADKTSPPYKNVPLAPKSDITPDLTPILRDAIDKATRTIQPFAVKNTAKKLGFAPLDTTVIFSDSQGGLLVAIQQQNVNYLLTKYPNAEFRTADGAESPVVVYDKGQPVAVVMPVRRAMKQPRSIGRGDFSPTEINDMIAGKEAPTPAKSAPRKKAPRPGADVETPPRPRAGFRFAELETVLERGTQTPEIKSLFRQAARLVHPDLGNQNDPVDIARRTAFMQAAVNAYEQSDGQRLAQLMDLFQKGTATPTGGHAPPAPPPGAQTAPTPPAQPPPEPPYSASAPDRSPLEMPEIVELGKALFEGTSLTIGVQAQLRRDGQVRGYFTPGRGIRLRADIFKDPEAAANTVAHEIGHAVDWIEGNPDQTLARGNILGSIASLHRFMRREFQGILNKDIRDELIAFTNAWKPFDVNENQAYTRYRHNARELYADFISGLLNAPTWTRQVAPRTFDAFFQFLDAKPRVKALYDGIQRRIETGGISQRRRERVEAMFQRGETGRQARAAERTATGRFEGFSDFVMRTFVDQDHSILKPVRAAERAGRIGNPEDNPRFWMERLRYGKAEERAWLSEQEPIKTALDHAGITETEFGAILFHERVIHERAEFANPEGFTPRSSQQQLDQLRTEMGDEKWQTALANATRFRDAWTYVRERMKQAEILTPQGQAAIETNPFYATFNVLHYWERQAETTPEFGISSGVFSQVGTLSEVENPYVATILKGVSTIRMVNRKEAAHALVEFLQEHDPGVIHEAKRGDKGFFQPSRDPRQGTLAYPHQGRLRAFYLPKEMVKSFENDPTVYQQAGRYLSVVANPFRNIFVRYNPGFMMFNSIRDPLNTAMNLPVEPVAPPFRGPVGRAVGRAFTLAKGVAMPLTLAPHFIRAIPPSLRAGLKGPDELIAQLERGRMLPSVMDEVPLNEDDTTVERLLKSYSLRPRVWQNRVVRPFGKMLNYVEALVTASELMSRVAAHSYLKNLRGFSDIEKEHMVRILPGTPPVLLGGEARPVFNNIMLFSNVWIQGMRRDWGEAFRRDPTDYMMRRMVWSLTPKLLMAGAAAGLLGEWAKAVMDSASEYDKTNYTTVPLALREDGKGVYLKLPNDELGRILGGVLWKIINIAKDQPGGDIGPLFDYMAGQAPTVSPLYQAIFQTMAVALSRNPVDHFRNRPVVNETEFEAGGYRRWAAFANHLWNNAGGGLLIRDLPRRVLPETLSGKRRKLREAEQANARSWLEQTLRMPSGMLNPVQRFLKISDQGHSDRLRALVKDIRQERSQSMVAMNEDIVDFIHTHREQLPLVLPEHVVRGLHRKMLVAGHPVGSVGQFRSRVRTLNWIRVDNPHFQAYSRAQSQEERLQIISDLVQTQEQRTRATGTTGQ